MKKTGFTMIELLGVITILALIAILAFPPIIEQIRKTKGSISGATLKLIESATSNYMDRNKNDYPIYSGNVFCISLQTLVNSGELEPGLTDIKTGETIDLSQIVKVEIESSANIDYSVVDENACVITDNTPIPNADKSGASAPELSENMIPIKWDGYKWVKADKRNPNGNNKWYDYDKKEWANAVLVNSTTRQKYKNALMGTEVKEDDIMAYLVWVPRYRYTLFNVEGNSISPQSINITFESKTTTKSTGATNGTPLTHPAFTFGTEELNGFWVGKFETTGTAATPTIRPNVESLRNQSLSTQFATSQKFNTLSTYGLTVSNDAHMMKSSEWGAVAYLSHSKYGKNNEIWINNSSTYITGCAGDIASDSSYNGCKNAYYTANGVNASTTGNIYGIYDMSGGAWEKVMAVMNNTAGIPYSGINSTSNSGFNGNYTEGGSKTDGIPFPNAKYYNSYSYGTTSQDQAAYDRSIIGDSTKEVKSWYSDLSVMVNSAFPLMSRGGSNINTVNSGIFNFAVGGGSAYSDNSFRTVILGK